VVFDDLATYIQKADVPSDQSDYINVAVMHSARDLTAGHVAVGYRVHGWRPTWLATCSYVHHAASS
jgi:hypothetical protein